MGDHMMDVRVIAMPTLTDAAIENGRALIEGLECDGHPIDAAAWIFAIEWEEWRLLLSFRDYRAWGMRKCLATIDELSASEFREITAADTYVTSPDDYIVKQLRTMIKRVRTTHGNRWVEKLTFCGITIEKAWLYRLFPTETPASPN